MTSHKAGSLIVTCLLQREMVQGSCYGEWRGWVLRSQRRQVASLSSVGAVLRKGSSDLSGSARTFPYCALISLAPKHSTQLFSIGRPQVFTAKLIRGYLRDKKQSASLASIHKEPPQELQSKQVFSQEPALNNHSHDLFQVSLQLSLCSGGNRMGRNPRIGDALGRRVGSCSASQSPTQDRDKGSIYGEMKSGNF